jgi:NADPH2:quinone reductase
VLGLTMITGGMAEVVVLPDRFRRRTNVSFEAGAGVLFNDLTVLFALRTWGRLMPGETVLVHGAAGGIGTRPCGWPDRWAPRTIAVVSTEEKVDVAKAAGADDVVLADGFKDAVMELTGGRGVDIVLDPVGGDRVTDSLRCLARPAGCWWSASPAGTSPPSRQIGCCSTTSSAWLGRLDHEASGISGRAVGRARHCWRPARPAPSRTSSRSNGPVRPSRAGEPQRQGQSGAPDPGILMTATDVVGGAGSRDWRRPANSPKQGSTSSCSRAATGWADGPTPARGGSAAGSGRHLRRPHPGRSAGPGGELGCPTTPTYHHGNLINWRGKVRSLHGNIPSLSLPSLLNIGRIRWQFVSVARDISVTEPWTSTRARELDRSRWRTGCGPSGRRRPRWI